MTDGHSHHQPPGPASGSGASTDAPGHASWAALGEELDTWATEGRTATFWWRDDDAGDATPALDRLLDLSERHNVPLGLAVIPARATEALAARIAGAAAVAVLQHGWSHANHAPSSEKQTELSDHAPAAILMSDLERGWKRLTALFGRQALPVMVPPWNRMDPTVGMRLADWGYVAVSGSGARRAGDSDAPRLQVLNVHIDMIDWHGSRGFIGDAAALDMALVHLRDRRLGQADANEPTGLMTHHLDHDAACWDFVNRLLDATTNHTAARWLSVAEALAVPQ